MATVTPCGAARKWASCPPCGTLRTLITPSPQRISLCHVRPVQLSSPAGMHCAILSVSSLIKARKKNGLLAALVEQMPLRHGTHGSSWEEKGTETLDFSSTFILQQKTTKRTVNRPEVFPLSKQCPQRENKMY